MDSSFGLNPGTSCSFLISKLFASNQLTKNGGDILSFRLTKGSDLSGLLVIHPVGLNPKHLPIKAAETT